MAWIRKTLMWVVGIVAVLAAGSYLVPSKVSVERSIEIAAAPEAVFPHVNSLQAFHEWSPWSGRDPEMTVAFSGPRGGGGQPHGLAKRAG